MIAGGNHTTIMQGSSDYLCTLHALVGRPAAKKFFEFFLKNVNRF